MSIERGPSQSIEKYDLCQFLAKSSNWQNFEYTIGKVLKNYVFDEKMAGQFPRVVQLRRFFV
jgi:hypothetical protein